jgi:hypothetical protein
MKPAPMRHCPAIVVFPCRVIAPGRALPPIRKTNSRAEKPTRPAFFVKPRSTFKMPQKNLKKILKYF